MRTKLVLGAALLAAGLASSMAQNVYSLNVVGYVNQTVQANHWYLMANPLSAGDNTAVSVMTNLVAAAGDTTAFEYSQIYYFDPVAGWGAGNDIYYTDGGYGWANGDATYKNLTPGKAFWFYPTSSGTVTFVGQVMTTNNFNLAGSATHTGTWNMIGSAFPVSTNLVALGIAGQGDPTYTYNDYVLRYDAVKGWDQGTYYYNAVGWVGTDWNNNSYPPEGPTLNVGEGIWYENFNTPVVWQQIFTIN